MRNALLLKLSGLVMVKIFGFIMSFILCFIVLPRISFGEEWIITPSIAIGGQYDDNIRLSLDSPDAVFGTELTGILELSRLTDIFKFSGSAELSYIDYTGDNPPPSDTDQVYEFSSLYKTQRGQWRLDGAYKRDTLLRTADVIIESDDDSIPTDDDIDILSVVRESILRQRVDVLPSWNYRLTERTRLGLNYRLNYVTYDDEDAIGVDLDDYNVNTVRGRIMYDLSEVDRIGAIIESKFFRASEGNKKADTYSLLATAEHRFSETAKGKFTIGIRQTSFENGNNSGDEFGYRLRVDGIQQTRFGSFNLRLEHDLFPSGFGQLFETNQLIFRMNKTIMPRLDMSVRTRYFSTSSFEQQNSINDRKFLSFEPNLSWQLSKWWSINATYRFYWEKRDIESQSAESNTLFFSLNYERSNIIDD